MIVPSIHMNGTGGKALLEQVTEAAYRAKLFLDALADMAPNGRDYYPQGPTALKQATADNKARASKVLIILNELTNLSEAIADAMDP